jgi:hypothetical protein
MQFDVIVRDLYLLFTHFLYFIHAKFWSVPFGNTISRN